MRGETRLRDRKRKKAKMKVWKRGMNHKQEYDDNTLKWRKERGKETWKSSIQTDRQTDRQTNRPTDALTDLEIKLKLKRNKTLVEFPILFLFAF